MKLRLEDGDLPSDCVVPLIKGLISICIAGDKIHQVKEELEKFGLKCSIIEEKI